MCNKIRRVYKGIDFRIVGKHASEWEDYIGNISKIYGFKRKENPTAFTNEGRYVGGYEETVQELTRKFGAHSVALEEADIVRPEDYTLRNKLESLGDRISSSFANHLKQGSFNFDKEKFEVVDLDTRIVFAKYLKRFTPQLEVKTFEEVDLDEVIDKFDDFDIAEVAKYDRKNSQEFEDETKPKKAEEGGASPKRANDDRLRDTKSGGGSPANRENSSDKGSRKNSGGTKVDKPEADEVIESPSPPTEGQQTDQKITPVTSKVMGSDNKLPSDNHSHTHREVLDSKGELVKDVDKEIDEEELAIRQEEEAKRQVLFSKLLDIRPQLKSLKKWHVSGVGNNYELCLHPEPVFKRHCILTKNGRLKYEEPLIKYKTYEEKADMRVRISDFSLVHKYRVDPFSRPLRDEELSNIQSSTLNSRFLDMYRLFTDLDLNCISDLVNQLDSFAFYRILPREHASDIEAPDFKSLMNQCVHVVRREDLLDDMNDSVAGFTALDGIDIDVAIMTGKDLISDDEIDTLKAEELEKRAKRIAKAQLIEEKRARREERERAERERLEAEKKAAEEWALKEKEAARSPAKAAALKLEKEKLEQERLAKEKEAKEAKERAEQEKNSPVSAASKPLVPEGSNDQPDLTKQPETDPQSPIQLEKVEDYNLFESGIELKEQEEEPFENPLKKDFFRFMSSWEWGTPHRIYKRKAGESPEELGEAISMLVKAMVHSEEISADDLNKTGINLIICKDWVLLTILNKPWLTYGNKQLYWEPWSYLGFFTLPILLKTWPETYELGSADCHKDVKKYLKGVMASEVV